jgi:hypothetical protein
MSKTLSIELPDEVYQTLLQTSQQLGKSPEAICLRHAAAIAGEWILNQHSSQAVEPLDTFIGAFNSEIPDCPRADTMNISEPPF